MPKLNRRLFLTGAVAVGATRGLPQIATKAANAPPMRWVLTLVYDKSLGMMRAVERLVP
ncbi:Tat pathway signal protein [Aliiroseovarius sp. Z3]|uniref:Tat pathway signal protein n=1 Tax=Aliiroseovarius sp. Z3 TaxID=2811402 RepID=UPI0023B35334|nr:Tat pathway signal protein [Aliiroseovarius sp. Z3]MDE9451030.1 Tat pathway signal protein [Aliiroseovarius sp. Z3]